jgi:ATPase subunit of ABC transporter with duplicated ATPase domains
MPRILEIAPAGLRSYGGNYEDYQRQRDTEQQAARAVLEHAVTERRRTRSRMQKEHDASQRRSAQTLRTVDTLNIASFERVKYKGAAKERPGTLRRQHREQNAALNGAVNQARERLEVDAPVMFTLPGSHVPEGKQVLVMEALMLPHGAPVAINWRIDGPMRVALRGPNGCGKSTLLKIILGEQAPLSGLCQLSVAGAYLDQHLSQLDCSLSVLEHLSLADTPLEEGVLRTRLAQLQLGADKVTLPLAALSGGERLKAALACVLWRRNATQLLLLDEPTNHLDLASTQAIEAALATFPGALMVVSHDDAFLQGLKLTHTIEWRDNEWHGEVWRG